MINPRPVLFWLIFGTNIGLGIATTHAQPRTPQAPPPEAHVTVTKVQIVLSTETCQMAPNTISLVIDGVDGHPYDASRTDTNQNVWTAPNTRKFDVATANASVRFKNQHTDCRRGRPVRETGDTWVARFEFNCSTGAAQNVAITTKLPIAVSYVRRLRAGDAESVDCAGGAYFFSDRLVNWVRLPSERLVLQLGRKQPDLRAPGVLVNELPFVKDPRNHPTKPLTRAEIVDHLRRQRLDRDNSNSIEIDEETLKVLYDLAVVVQ
jgi:hypothetical protein